VVQILLREKKNWSLVPDGSLIMKQTGRLTVSHNITMGLARSQLKWKVGRWKAGSIARKLKLNLQQETLDTKAEDAANYGDRYQATYRYLDRQVIQW
jgi:hypothetical protein